MMKKPVLIIPVAFLSFLLLFAGCAEKKPDYARFREIPEVKEFLAQYPTAKIESFYLDKEAVKKFESLGLCDKKLQEKGYWVIYVGQKEESKELLVDANTYKVECLMEKGRGKKIIETGVLDELGEKKSACGNQICEEGEKYTWNSDYCPEDCKEKAIKGKGYRTGSAGAGEKEPEPKAYLSIDTRKTKYYPGEEILLTDPPDIDLGNVPKSVKPLLEKLPLSERYERVAEINAIKRAIALKGGAWKAGYNKISILSNDEFKGLLGLQLTKKQEADVNKRLLVRETGTRTAVTQLPRYFDWRNLNGQNYITPIKDQSKPHKCGSCWAFAATAGVEAKALTYYNNPALNLDLAEQGLVSCCTNCGNGCNGGYPPAALAYIKDTGLGLESCYPYTSIDARGCIAYNECGYNPTLCSEKCSSWSQNAWKIGGYESLPDNKIETIKRTLMEKGPIVTGMAVYEDFKVYTGGIYSHSSGALLGYHAILMVGWGEHDGLGYWIIKNSWGTDWGEKGYFRINMRDSMIDSLFLYSIDTPIPPVQQSVLCMDSDSDGYCYWGTGSKPSNCPACDDSIMDCDDSNAEIFKNCNMSVEPLGVLKVETNPGKAEVYVKDLEFGNYVFRGTTPENGSLEIYMNPGEREVKIKKVYYQSETRVVTVEENASSTLSVSLKVEADYLNGWPVELHPTGEDTYSNTPTLYDLDGDGEMEVIIGEYAYEYPSSGRLHVLNYDGTERENWPKELGQFFRSSAAVGDIDGDNVPEIVVTGDRTSKIYAFSPDGKIKNGWPKSIGETIASPSLADLDGDGAMEVIASGYGKIYAFHGDGSNVNGWPEPVESYTGVSTPAIADLDDDGNLEVIAGGGTKIYAWHHDGTTVEGWPKSSVSSGVKIFTSPAVGDIDGDGEPEIVAGDLLNIYAWHHDGTTVEGWPKPFCDFKAGGVAIADMDGDGKAEIVMGISTETSVWDGKIYVLESDGSIMPGWPVWVGGRIYSSPVVADVDGDGKMEIAIGTTPHLEAGQASKVIRVFNRDGSELKSWGALQGIHGSPSIGDIDGDGDIELAIASDDGVVHVLELNGQFNEQAVEWQTFQHDFQHRGVYPGKKPEQSKIVNNLDYELKGTLIMRLEKYKDGLWQLLSTVVNKEIVVQPGETYKLDQEWNPSHTALMNGGKYRVYAALVGENGQPISVEENNLEGTAEFEVSFKGCQDDTQHGECSKQKPMYCWDGTLVPKCSKCGCYYPFEVCDSNEECRDAPDLLPQKPITVNPATDEVKVVVRNEGKKAAGPFRVKAWLDKGWLMERQDVNFLDAGATMTLKFQLQQPSGDPVEGKHLVTVVVDTEDSVEEGDEGNNKIDSFKEFSEPKSDLVVSGIMVDPDTDEATAIIENQGDAKATVFEVEFTVDYNMPGGSWKINSLKGSHQSGSMIVAGETKELTEYYGKFFTTGEHNIKVEVDPSNLVNESNESNNVKEITADFGKKPQNCGDNRCMADSNSETEVIILEDNQEKTVSYSEGTISASHKIKCVSVNESGKATISVDGSQQEVEKNRAYKINSVPVYVYDVEGYPTGAEFAEYVVLIIGNETPYNCPEDCEQKCFDEDGKNYFNRGYAIKRPFGAADFCSNDGYHLAGKGSYLKESYCKNNELKTDIIQCPCKFGKCIGKVLQEEEATQQ